MDDCLFCKIVAKKIPARIIYEDDDAVAFEDINPQAPTHTLIVPRHHIAGLKGLSREDGALVGRLAVVASVLAHKKGLESFRTVINTGPGAGQTVFHLHLHLLGGRPMGWPPG